MVVKKISKKDNNIGLYMQRIFAIMFGAVGLTALICYLTIYMGGLSLFFTPSGVSPLYYIVVFGAFGLSIYAQVRAFSLKPSTAILLLAIYSGLIGFGMAPFIFSVLKVNPVSIFYAFVIASLMFGCMALFGYKTLKNLSFLGVFLQMGMIGLILVSVFSIFFPIGSSFITIICLLGVLIFALFTAYDIQNLKLAYSEMSDDLQKNQLAVLGALHLYISFIAMFRYVLQLLDRR